MVYNTNTRNELAAAFGALFNGGTLEIRTAANAVLATITLPGSPFGAPSAGAVAKSGTWSATASATGTAAKAVFISADTNETAEVTCGIVDTELIINSVSIVAGGTVTVNTYTYTVPAS